MHCSFFCRRKKSPSKDVSMVGTKNEGTRRASSPIPPALVLRRRRVHGHVLLEDAGAMSSRILVALSSSLRITQTDLLSTMRPRSCVVSNLSSMQTRWISILLSMSMSMSISDLSEPPPPPPPKIHFFSKIFNLKKEIEPLKIPISFSIENCVQEYLNQSSFSE